MKKAVHILGLLLPIVLFYACNEITAEQFVLTDDNTPLHNISYKYWYPQESKTLKKDDIFVVENAKKGRQKRLWMVTPFQSDSKKLQVITFRPETIYLRTKEFSKGNFIFQATSWESAKNISLFLGSFVNDSTMQFYGFNDEAMAFGSQSSLLADIQNHVTVEKDNIKFDSIASTNHKKEILAFIEELDNPKYYEDEIVTLVGTNDIEKIKSLLKE